MPRLLLNRLGQSLAFRKLTIATVENSTGGRFAAEFASVPQARSIVRGGLVCYDQNLKSSLITVSGIAVENPADESAKIAEALVRGLKKMVPADIHVAVTGVPVASSGDSEVAAGTMFISILFGKDFYAVSEVFEGSPERIALQTIERAVSLLLKIEKYHRYDLHGISN